MKQLEGFRVSTVTPKEGDESGERIVGSGGEIFPSGRRAHMPGWLVGRRLKIIRPTNALIII